jgi:hypothetical protein
MKGGDVIAVSVDGSEDGGLLVEVEVEVAEPGSGLRRRAAAIILKSKKTSHGFKALQSVEGYQIENTQPTVAL